MPRRRASDEILNSRLRNIYNGQRRRAKKYHKEHEIDYEVSDLKKMVFPFRACPYCLKPVTASTFTIDHVTPVARGGAFRLSNLQCCCAGCNRAKSSLFDGEFRKLIIFLNTCDDYMKKNVIMRLKAGGAWMAGWTG